MLFAILVPLLSLNAQSNDYKFSHLGTNEGLSTGTVNCVFKDSRGYIWIGTIDGLNRYDGYQIKIYKSDKDDPKSIVDNIITSIAEDQNGMLWVGTRGNGISIFNPETEEFSIPDPTTSVLSSVYVRDIDIDEKNNVLVATSGNGLFLFNWTNLAFQQYEASSPTNDGLSSNFIYSILRAAPSKYWLGTRSDGVDYFDLNDHSFDHLSLEKNQKTETANRKPIFIDHNNVLWVGTDGDGLYSCNLQSLKIHHYEESDIDGLQSGIITAFYEDDRGRLHIGTDGKGIHILSEDRKSFNYLQSSLIDDTDLSSDAIYEIYEDNSGVLWVSTFRGGVNIYSPAKSKFKLLEQQPYADNSLSFNSVIGLTESKDGSIWIGTDGGGLDRVNPKTGLFKHYKHDPESKNSLSGNVIKGLFHDSQENIWAGTYAAGLNRLNLKTGKITQFLPDPEDPHSLGNQNVWAIFEDHFGTIWVGLLGDGGGLARFNPEDESFTHYLAGDSPTSLSSDLIITLLEDSKEQFWVGTEDNGLNLFDRDKETFERFLPGGENSILDKSIRAIMEDRSGMLWIGTANGVNLLDPETHQISVAKVNELLPSKVVNGIEEDEKGFIWISSNKGISKYDPVKHEIRNFSQSDGLQGNEFNYTASLKSKDGMIYFGGLNGLNYFDPQEIQLSEFNPPLVITDLKIFDQSITSSNRVNGRQILTSSLDDVESITLTHKENVFTIEFASLDYTAPAENQYQYMLEGFDESWVNTNAAKRSATYTNLDAGTYIFKVKGTNSDGIWSSQERILEIEVLPPWWATLWFRGLVVLVIFISGIWVYRWRIAQIKEQQRRLEDQVKKATEKVKAQNETLKDEQESLQKAIEETNFVVGQAVDSGNFKARIELDNKTGEWKALGASVNQLFESILLPFEHMNSIVNALANSDLSLRYEDDAKGDVLRLKENLNNALENLSVLLSDIIKQVEVIGSSTHEMALTSEEMNVSTGEIASSIGEMSKGAHDQVTRIDESSQLIEGILQFSGNVSSQAKGINEAAERGVDKSDEGKALIETLDDRMKNIIKFSAETNESMKLLTNRSLEISRVLNIIKEVAKETNLLALNAAIEAAKAGDAGKGFAVVAEQIRLLAENSGSSVKNTQSMIDEIQHAIKNTASLVAEMETLVKGGEEASKNASASFESLATSYAQTLTMSEEIVKATGQQTTDLSRVVGIMESVVVIAEQTASGTEEIASSSSELSAGMSAFNNRTKIVMEIVEGLKKQVAAFRLKDQ
ncbi:MAG: methyl-accepting chemotaxis protein/streptogramin lyase [Marinoscillum sp.]|jgi:methyl-accepting chemotaxis protein/streptogramin lyase